MTSITFDSLKYARRLREAGVPEPQADAQAELMAEAFGFYADNILTRGHFESVLDARLDARLAQHDAALGKRFGKPDERFFGRFSVNDVQFHGRFDEQYSRLDACFDRLDRILCLNTWMLVIIILVLVVPQLWAWVA